ncbi:flagellar biosynthetic protein FliO [Carnobacterium sp. ISL-102]|uniref:flagellar biosynthetic protein FliO n=1 Tax=Carnobacterium sp. ISL-102 TaxID=2819142 RepID=UPI001BE7E9D5|nr:flagellar biosynthetic protein FliO [Carnobacterium sp. ISL-102]MBT2731874.1 flagellar biosynthetic protein FliO [Carnobacterium sp. ISL-102]
MELGLSYVLKSVVALIVIILAANYGLKYLNTFMIKKNQVIKVIERTPISKSSALSIVEIADTYYLMSFTDTRNEILRELTAVEKEKITSSIEEKRPAGPMNQKKQQTSKKAVQTFKSLRTQYQSFYEKRK